MELMSLNVSTQNVEKVIRSVLQHIARMNVENLPKPTTLIEMTAEMKGLLCQQLAEQLTRTEDLTLQNDGTSKFGQHYGGFQVSLPDSSYSLGLCEMLTGSADLILKSLQMILADIKAVAGDGTGNKILANIKNTMSNRHIVEKKFNTLLEDYRCEILPSVVADWDALSEDEQLHLLFFCGMYLTVGMADCVLSTLLQWENAYFDEPPSRHVLACKSSSCSINSNSL